MSGYELGLLMYYSFFILLAIVIFALIMRWMFRVNTIVKLMERNNELLEKVLKKDETAK